MSVDAADSTPVERRRSMSGAWLLALTLLLSACGIVEESTTTLTLPPPDTAVTTSPVTTSPVTTSAVTTGPAANDLEAFARAELPLTVGGSDIVMQVAVADGPMLRGQGLMGVTDLVDVDGMLFVWNEEIEAAFWMKDTLIPLDIWFFDDAGRYVDSFTMTPCESDPCPTYPAAGPFRYALETEVGTIDAEAAVAMDPAGFQG